MPTPQKLFCKSCFKKTNHLPGGNPLGMVCNCGTVYVDPFNKDIHKNLEAIVMVAKHDAKDHNCNYNIIMMNTDEEGNWTDSSTYEIVADSYFKKERPNAKLLTTTLQLGVLIYNEWLPYTEYEKQECDIKLKDGTVIKHCYPNAGNFTTMCADSIKPVPEDEVVEIMYREYYLKDLCKGNCNNETIIDTLGGIANFKDVESTYAVIRPNIADLKEIYDDVAYSGLPNRGDKKITGKIVKVRTEPKIQRNAPCPCGSGKKHKKCCLGKA